MGQKLKQDIQIGSMIRKLRIERHMTQEQVVTKLQLENLDITRSIYSQIEGGRYSIRISILAGLVKVFRVDYNTFFQEVDISHLKSKE
ncbi:XRE family transcriptional regulator [Lachnospiraceae bacterium]|nr:helix-turn-helix transcriptional regulator [uncultured Schaedlerella sp.]NBI99580.1 XRE family transcriptional regulator [Lachnospiraceae bacterium]